MECQQAELRRLNAGDKTQLDQQQLCHPLGRGGWKLWVAVEKEKELGKLKGSEALRWFGKLVFGQMSSVNYQRNCTCV